MSLATRSLGLTRDVVRELGMVVPRTVAGLNESTGWAPATPRGVRQFGEVMLDELVLSGFSLLGAGPAKRCGRLSDAPRRPRNYRHWVSTARTREPEPLRVQALQRRRIGRLAYERMTFEHDPSAAGDAGGRGSRWPGDGPWCTCAGIPMARGRG